MITKKINGWKIATIILAIFIIIETFAFGCLLWIGTKAVEKEDACKIRCGALLADAFRFEYSTCSCIKNNEVIEVFNIT